MHIGITGPISLAPFADLLPPEPAPPQTYSFPLVGKLVRSLVERGHEVSVFAGSKEIAEVWESSGQKIRLTIVPLRKRGAAYDFYRQERALLIREMRKSGCDVIHAHWTYEFAAAALAQPAPCLVTAHDSPFAILRYFVCTRHFPFWTARALLGAYVVRKARWLTTVSPYCREALRRSLFPRASIRVVPNGIDEAILEEGAKRLSEGPPKPPFCVATMLEGFQERKNPEAALRAFAILRRALPAARLVMFGTGFGPGEAAEKWAYKHGLAEGVEFAGKTTQAEMFRRMQEEVHLLLHPAREESFGMAALEAMAMGIPVIGGMRAGGIPYVLGGGEAGLLLDVESPQKICEGILSLAENASLYRKFSVAGHERARTIFPLEKMVDSYEAEYRKILHEC